MCMTRVILPTTPHCCTGWGSARILLDLALVHGWGTWDTLPVQHQMIEQILPATTADRECSLAGLPGAKWRQDLGWDSENCLSIRFPAALRYK